MNSKIKIGIIDDQAIFCDSLKVFLDRIENIEVILTAYSGDDLLKKLSSILIKPDILLLDIDMPKMDGITLLPIIKKKHPTIRLIMLSLHSDLNTIEKALDYGASGYVRKGGSINDIFEAIDSVFKYNFFLDKEVVEQLNADRQKGYWEKNENNSLDFTKRELQVLKLICKEKATKQIADILNASIKSIEYNRACLFKKSTSESLVGLVYFAIKNKLD